MDTGKALHHRRSIRFEGYDYASEGGYFIKVVTHLRKCLFGSVENDEMKLNRFGNIVKDEWFKTAALRPNIELLDDEFVVMPNHIHGIIWIDYVAINDAELSPMNINSAVGAYSHTPLRSSAHTVGAIIRGFKGAVTTKINTLLNTPGSTVWQRNYYDHIITSEKDYENIVNYIDSNPLSWHADKEYFD